MKFTRRMVPSEGWDDIYDTCKHTPKGDHGISAARVMYIVEAEVEFGRKVALSITVRSDQYPSSIPKSHFGLTGRGDPARATDMTLHAQPLSGTGGVVCDVMCGLHCMGTLRTTAIGAEEFYRLHGNPDNAFDQPESFWNALGGMLAQHINDGDHVQPPEDMSIDSLIDAIEGHARAKGRSYPIAIARWIGGPRFEVSIAGAAIGQNDSLTIALRQAFDTYVVKNKQCL